MPYAVIDLETTGLKVDWHDRVVEIAIVQVDASGTIESEWCSVVNPERDLGPQYIHGISAAEARQAPTFGQLAATIVDRLHSRVLVAHNLPFDAEFLLAEFRRLGITLEFGHQHGLCTMRLAGQFMPGASRRLADCCATVGIELTNAHAALHDARAAANLLSHFISLAGPSWVRATPFPAWPELPSCAVAPMQRRAAGHTEPHYLTRLIERMPRTHNPDADAYLDVLDRALLDRHISLVEGEALVSIAGTLGLGRDDLLEVHRDYFLSLATIAVADGAITDAEEDDLVSVAALLALAPTDVERALRTARHAVALAGEALVSGVRRLHLRAGDTVVFTGDTGEPREVWEERAARAGLRVGTGVTRQTRIVVAADPDTMSGKAEKAARYGIPIIHPRAFTDMLQDL